MVQASTRAFARLIKFKDTCLKFADENQRRQKERLKLTNESDPLKFDCNKQVALNQVNRDCTKGP